jgi:hypothetical protein
MQTILEKPRINPWPEASEKEFEAWQRFSSPRFKEEEEEVHTSEWGGIQEFLSARKYDLPAWEGFVCLDKVSWEECRKVWGSYRSCPDLISGLVVVAEGDSCVPKPVQREMSADAAELQEIFQGLVEQWRKATLGYALTYRRYAHPSYQAILALGKDVIPLVLRELEVRPDWWFEALRALTKTDPTKPGDNFQRAVKAWLEWGKANKKIPA